MNKFEPEELAALQAAAPEMFEALLVALPLVEAAKKSDLFEAGVAERVAATMREAINKAVNGKL